MKKEYPVPEEIVSLLDKSNALLNLRDAYVRRPFGYKKAKRAAIESFEAKRAFWDRIYELYPEIKITVVTFDSKLKVIEVEEEAK